MGIKGFEENEKFGKYSFIFSILGPLLVLIAFFGLRSTITILGSLILLPVFAILAIKYSKKQKAMYGKTKDSTAGFVIGVIGLVAIGLLIIGAVVWVIKFWVIISMYLGIADDFEMQSLCRECTVEQDCVARCEYICTMNDSPLNDGLSGLNKMSKYTKSVNPKGGYQNYIANPLGKIKKLSDDVFVCSCTCQKL